MHANKSPLGRLVALALLLTISSGPAFAYIDPNAGGMLFQLLAPLLAAFVGGWLFLRRWITTLARELWTRLTGRGRE